jgi:hypothetical protein
MRKESFVRKTSYKWERFILLIFAQTQVPQWNYLRSSLQKNSQTIGKGFFVLALISLWWWNWQLLVATGVGIGLMWLTYQVSPKQWHKLWEKAISSLTGSNRKLVFAVLSGSLGGFITYMITAIWADSENRWLATGSILQGFGTLITLILLGWQINRQSSDRYDAKFEQLIEDLTAADSLKRFIAIRQLTNLGHKKALNREQRRQLIEYFHFMLAQSPETSIQEALFDSLDVLGVSAYSFPYSQSSQNHSNPIQLKHSVAKNVRDLV